MGQAGGFASKPGASSLVQQQADRASTGTPGKRSLVEQLRPLRAGGVAAETVSAGEHVAGDRDPALDPLAGGAAHGSGEAPAEATAPGAPATAVEHATELAAPEAGNERTMVGVGEKVIFAAQGDGSWQATAGTALGHGPRFAWTAPATPTAATVTFHPSDGAPIATQMTVIAPSAVRMTKVADDSFGAGEAGAGMIARVTLHPLTVSFAATQWKEDSGQPGTAAAGYFTGKTLPVHEANPSWIDVGDGNTGPTDHAAFSRFPEPWTQGSFEWAIANRYKLRGEPGAGHLIDTSRQVHHLEGPPHAGRATVSKAGATSAARAPMDDPAFAEVVGQGSGAAPEEGTEVPGGAADAEPGLVHEAVGRAGAGGDALASGHAVGRGASKGDDPKKKKDDQATADLAILGGLNHRLLGTAGMQVVLTKWFEDGATQSGEVNSNPDKMKSLTEELRSLFWWMTDEQVKASRKLVILGKLSRPTFRTRLTTGTFQTFGLPPGTDIVWKKESGGAVSLILSIRGAGIEQPPELAKNIEVTDELRKRVDERFETTFGVRPQYSMLGSKLDAQPQHWAWVITYDKAALDNRVGADWAKAEHVQTSDPTTEDTSVFGGVTFPNYIPLEDRQYYLKWMEEAVGKQSPSAGGGSVQLDDDLIRAMRALDANKLLKEQVIDRMRAAQQAGGAPVVLDAVGFRRLVHETKEEQERIRLGIAPATSPAPAPDPTQAPKPYTSPHAVQVAPGTRAHERPLTGRIINLGSLASVGKSMDLTFETEDPQGFGFAGVTIDWYASPMGEPTSHVRKGHTFHYAHHKPEPWPVSFGKVGKYEITARVDHQSYWPTTFKSFVEVKTEADRLNEVEQHAFGELDDKTQVTESSHFFDVSFTNDRFGPDKYTFGKVREGGLPDDWDPQTLDQRLGFMKRDREALNKLIAQHKGRSNKASKDLVAYAEHALETMRSTEGRIRADARDLFPFEVRGAFLSEQNGVRSGDLNLVGLAGSRHKTTTIPGDEAVPSQKLEWDQPTVRLHDMSQLYEPKHAVYTGEGKDFRQSAEQTFIDLCKSYPPGRVSLVMEQLDATGARTGKTLGFELHTGTAWKDVKQVVWSPEVQLAVNLAGAAAAIFIPGAGAVVAMALVTAYNAVDTIDNLATLQRKGQATWKDGVAAGVTIGLDLVPFAGELKAVGKLGKSTLFALDVAQVASNVAVVTDQGLQQIRALRDQHIVEIARLQEEIAGIRAANDSDPRIAAKERELSERIIEARGVADTVFIGMAKSGAVMLMAPLAFNHMLKGLARGTGAELAKADLFAPGPKGEQPHYNPETGKIHGDSSLLTPESIPKLQEAWVLDVHAKHADAANLLDVRTEEVILKRDPNATATQVKKNAEGVWEITAPEKRAYKDVLDDVWKERQKLPGAPAERPKALERGSYEPTFSADEIIAVGKPVVVGNRIESRSDADAIMHALAEGDRKALKSLGVPTLPKGFDPRSVEWGLGVLPDGKHVIVRGDHGAVDWGPFPELHPLAHTHPLRAGKYLKPDGGGTGIHVADMIKGAGANAQNRVSFFPSAADVAFCVRNALATHTVHTPYVHTGKGVVGNPVGDFADLPRISIEIVGARRIGSWEGQDHIPAHQAHVVVRDAQGTVLWEGDMLAVHHPSAGSLIEFGPPPAHWQKPGLGTGATSGGATPAPTRAPRNEVEELALADWQKLEQSGKNYGGKFDSDRWYDRYNEGLRYDEGRNGWYRPDGRKVKEPQKFDDAKRWTKKAVYDHLAGPKSESTFKSFAEMLIDEKIATRAQVEKQIEQLGFLGRDEDLVRHELKAAYHDEVLAAMKAPPTPEGKFEAMRRITQRLDSSDKGNLTEDWYRDVSLGGKGETHVAARKDVLAADQDIHLEKNRFVDIVDGDIGREIKSGEGKLGDADLSQMHDYARMVDGQATLRTASGSAQIKHVRYTFTSPSGAKANVEMMRKAFTDDKLQRRISFEVFTPEGKMIVIETPKQLEAQRWLFE